MTDYAHVPISELPGIVRECLRAEFDANRVQLVIYGRLIRGEEMEDLLKAIANNIAQVLALGDGQS